MNRVSELRAKGRTLLGVAVRYGRPERFAGVDEIVRAGAYAPVPESLPLNLQHDGGIEIARAILNDTSECLEVRAEVTKGIADLVTRGALSGLSVEFNSNKEYRNSGQRIIEKAELTGLAIVDRPAYSQARIELRRAVETRVRGSRLRGSMRVGRRYMCDCCGSDIQLSSESLESIVRQIEASDIKAHSGSLAPADLLASTGAGTLAITRKGDRLDFELNDLDSPAGADLIAASDVAGQPLIRPIIEDVEGTYEMVEGVRVYNEKIRLKSVLVKHVSDMDKYKGWQPAELLQPDKRVAAWLLI